MFTEGLDEKALDWVKQGSDINPQKRLPLLEKLPLQCPNSSTFLNKINSYLSPSGLPPVKLYSGLLETRLNIDVEDDGESVASVPEERFTFLFDTFGNDSLISSDSDPCEKMKKTSKEKSMPSSKQSPESVKVASHTTRGSSKKNFTVFDVFRDISLGEECDRGLLSSHSYFQDLGTPSAPPIMESERVDPEDESRVNYEKLEASPDILQENHRIADSVTRSNVEEENVEMHCRETKMKDQIRSFTTRIQNAWQTFIAYDACFRLCLNAWARNCMEAPEFLRDECVILRDAFGIQNYLLLPRGQGYEEGRSTDSALEAFMTKGKKGIEHIEVEVKKVRFFSRRRKSLHATFSQQSLYLQMGAYYVRNACEMLKSQINSITMNAFPDAHEEILSCSLQMKSSSGNSSSDSTVTLQPGSGDSHFFHPESHGDSLLVRVQDGKMIHLGHATIQISSLMEFQHGELIKWWPLYLEEHECVGKIQLLITISGTSNKINTVKGGMVSETLVYDIVLEAALRAQHFSTKNLQINGIWKWLLHEFSISYGVSDIYTKLRYLSCIMNIAIPTNECLMLIHELLLPTIEARDNKTMNRQERSIFLDCEDQIKNLLATIFENYKSLDESSPSGLNDLFNAVIVSAAPALAPAIQIFALLHDIFSLETQNILRNYLQNAAAKRCRRHMMETDEFVSSNSECFFTDPVAVSAAYLKMKGLCAHISDEIRADIKIHNQHVLPSFIDLPNIVSSVYNTELSRRLRSFLSACPPQKPLPHVTELLVATTELEGNMQAWNIMPSGGGLASRDLFHGYIIVWIQDTELRLLDFCNADKSPCSGVLTHYCTSSFVENMYDRMRESLNEYEVVINRWPQYLMGLENVVANVERAILKTLERQNSEVLMPLRVGIPKMLEKQMQKLLRGHHAALYLLPPQLGIFINTIRRIIDVLHYEVEEILKSRASYFTVSRDGNNSFGEQMNGITVMLRKKYKKYIELIVEKLISNMQSSRSTQLKRILEDTKEAESEVEIRERMQALCLQLTDSIRNMHSVFSSRIFVAICRGFWDKMGQIVLTFLESRKENRVWYRGSDYALGILDDLFTSEMQALLGNSVQAKDLDPPRSVSEARSILY